MRWRDVGVAGLMLSALVGCAQAPLGPQVQVLPGRDKSFASFQADTSNCEGYASQQVAGQAEYANNRAIGGAVLTTVLGAGLGAVVGGGRGAVVGSAIGAGLGTSANAGASGGGAQDNIQVQYDNAYAACMVGQGNTLPRAPVAVPYAVPYAVPVYRQPYYYGY